MTASLFFQLMLSLVTGLLLGAFFFGGLWMTVRNLQNVPYPWLLFLLSAMGRTLLVLTGFWCVGIWLSPTHQWQRLAICLFGFVVMRVLFTRAIKTGTDSTTIQERPR
ncbi:MAG: ATP synthase subunit I [Planctomycetaceae bacterium]